jgi:hypothetical protein
MRPDEMYRMFLRGSAALYGLGAVGAVAVHDRQRWPAAYGATQAKGPGLLDTLWPSPAASHFATLAAVSWAAGQDPTMSKRLTPAMLVANGLTSGLYWRQYRKTGKLPCALAAAASSLMCTLTGVLALSGRRYLWDVDRLQRVRILRRRSAEPGPEGSGTGS